MIAFIVSVFHQVSAWPGWTQFDLTPARVPDSNNIFGFAEYLASLALFLVVMTTSDFRFSYRLSLTKYDWKSAGFWLALGVGIALLTTDVWYQNGLPVPHFMTNPNNVKALIGLIFLAFVFVVISIALIRPPVFSKNNAEQFFRSNYHLIHQGDVERLQVVAEELIRSIGPIISLASLERQHLDASKVVPIEQRFAHDFLLLIGDDRFCRIVVDKVPAFALSTFQAAQRSNARLPIFQFARNIGQAFIRNTNSAFYQEDSGYYSGFVGIVRPITKVIFGDYRFVERCASDGASPLETDYREFTHFSPLQMEGYRRAALALFESCLEITKGRPFPHSYTLARMFDSFESVLIGVGELDGKKDYSSTPVFGRFSETIDFIKSAIQIVEKKAEPPKTLRISDIMHADIYDDLARLIFECVFSASTVSSPAWTTWAIQHNTVWNVFGLETNRTRRAIKIKVMRLMYDEIKKMNDWPNFKGARILGYCLNVLGLSAVDRHKGFQREDYPLQASAIMWAKKNFHRLTENNPRVADACLQGSVTYDADKRRLVKTFTNDTGKGPVQEFLELD